MVLESGVHCCQNKPENFLQMNLHQVSKGFSNLQNNQLFSVNAIFINYISTLSQSRVNLHNALIRMRENSFVIEAAFDYSPLCTVSNFDFESLWVKKRDSYQLIVPNSRRTFIQQTLPQNRCYIYLASRRIHFKPTSYEFFRYSHLCT